MPGLVTSKKSVKEGGRRSLLGGYVSRLWQGLIPLSSYIFLVFFIFSLSVFCNGGFSKEGSM